MVPSGWARNQIGDVAVVQVGRDLIEERYSRVQTDQHKYPVYSNTVENRGLYGFYDFPEYPGNSVTVVGRGIGLGTAFARFENEGFGAIGRLLVLSPKNEAFNVAFLADYINFCLRIHNESGGIPQLPGASLSKYFVTLPPLPEQEKIAQILSTWDKAITTTEQLIANSQQQKKALMQQLLTGKKRLLNDNGVKFSGEWKKGKLSDIANIDSGYAFKSTDFTDSEKGIPIIRMSDFKAGGIDISNAAKVIPETTIGLDRFKLKTGDFVFGMSGSLSNYGWVKEQDPPCFLNQRVGRILAKECAVQLFVTYLYLSDKIQQSILDKAAGAAQLNISSTDLRNTIVHYPSFEEQQKIAAVLSTADQEISAMQQKLDALQLEKKALMQQLLTGKRRVQIN